MAYIDAQTNRTLWRGVFILDPTTLQPNSQTYPGYMIVSGNASANSQSNPIWVQVAPGTAVGSGQQVVAAAGTAVALSATSVPILSVTVKALAANTGDVYVGGNNVTAANGYVLAAGEPVSMSVDDLTDVYIDAAVNGEGVSFIYVVP